MVEKDITKGAKAPKGHKAKAADAQPAAPEKKSKDNLPMPANAKKYVRDKLDLPIRRIEDKKLKGNLRNVNRKFDDAARKAAEAELLLPEEGGYLEAEGMEKTYKFRQEDIAKALDLNSETKAFELKLTDFGPYTLDYTKNGRYLLLGGRKGHIATFDWKSKRLGCELHVKETIRDVKWLHNETMFAVAQKKYTYIYDQTGMEIHCLKKHLEPNCIEFLPYHFLLATSSKSGRLVYQDTSTGAIVAEHRTRLGDCVAMRQNPYNAILHLGHSNGTVTLWSPSMNEPLVKMMCHRGPIRSLAVDRSGTYMVTSGLDGQMKVFDIRSYKPLHSYYTPTPATSLDISQTGMLSVAYGTHVSVWKDALKVKAQSPYMTHLQAGSAVARARFCPFDDVLGMGHNQGFRSLVVPGSGEPNYDALEANPYQTKEQRAQAETRALLEKIQPEMIAINPNFIATVDRTDKEIIAAERKLEVDANDPTDKFVPRKKARGKSSAMKRYLRKQANIIDPKRAAVIERLNSEKAEREKARKRARGDDVPEKEYSALDRFDVKRQKV